MIIGKDKIKIELQKVGISITDIYDLVNTNKRYTAGIPVLLDLMKGEFINIRETEGVVRALGVKEAIGKASPILIAEYNKAPKVLSSYRWAIGNTICTTITEEDIESILQIVQDKENGMSRQMFVVALGKIKSENAEDVLIKLLDDDEVVPHALQALGQMKSRKAKERISSLTNHPRPLIKKEAQKTLKRIG